MIDNMSMIFSK